MGWEEGADRKAASPPPRISYRKEGERRGAKKKEEATIFLGEGARESPRARLLPSTRVFIVLITPVWSGLGAGDSRRWGSAEQGGDDPRPRRAGESSRALLHPSPLRMLPGR